MKKKILALCLLLCLIVTISLFSSRGKEYFGFRAKDFTVIQAEDNHGGFQGEGTTAVILDCSQNREKALELVADWKELPLSENLNLMFYGGERDGMYYDFDLAAQANMPEVEHGFYCFQDRHSKSTDGSSDAEILTEVPIISPWRSMTVIRTGFTILNWIPDKANPAFSAAAENAGHFQYPSFGSTK